MALQLLNIGSSPNDGTGESGPRPIFSKINSNFSELYNAVLSAFNANFVFAGPVTGPAALPSFRTLQNADLPQIDVTKINTVGAASGAVIGFDGTSVGWTTSIVPTGTVLPFAGPTAPAGFLLCDGSAVSRTTYSNLRAVIGDAFGIGDGVNTFNIPDLRGRTPIGVDGSANRVTSASLNGANADTLGGTGGLETHSLTSAENGPHTHGGTPQLIADFDRGTDAAASNFSLDSVGSTASSGSGTPHNNMQPWLALNYIIRT